MSRFGTRANPYPDDPDLRAMRDKRLAETAEKRRKKIAQDIERREFYKAHGICVICRQADALQGLTVCQACRLYRNQLASGYVEHTRKWWEKERKAGRLYAG